MKIGAFARKFKLPTSMIRFYVQNGLLIPTKIGGQYDYDEKCVADMEIILKYKNYNFTIEEIQHLLILETAEFKDDIIDSIIANIFIDKRSKLISERDNLNKIIENIENEINSGAKRIINAVKIRGVAISFLPYLCCLYCNETLALKSAEINKGEVLNAVLQCDSCGEQHGCIIDGVMVCKSHTDQSPLKAFDNTNTLASISIESSSTYRSLIRRAYIGMYNACSSVINKKSNILLGPLSFNFLLVYIKKISKDSTIIVCDPSIQKIKKLKTYLDGNDHNIVYISGFPEDVPLKARSVDLFIDDYCITNYCFAFNDYPIERVASFLKADAKVVGVFTDYKKAPLTLNFFKTKNDIFNPSKMNYSNIKNRWLLNGLYDIQNKTIGKAEICEDYYPKSAAGEEIVVQIYQGKKSVV